MIKVLNYGWYDKEDFLCHLHATQIGSGVLNFLQMVDL